MDDNTQTDLRGERRENELALLQAMFPSDLTWHHHRQEMVYKPNGGGALTLRIPDTYPDYDKPVIISAINEDKNDIRDIFKQRLDALELHLAEEILDTIVQAFDETISECRGPSKETSEPNNVETANPTSYKTVIIWLHHLLNTNKRKLALNPSMDADKVTGATKPGYPGILVYSGATSSVDAHVTELRAQRWQAFQIRLEETKEQKWMFSHGSVIKEVESMSEVSQSIVSEHNRQTFLKAVGIK